MKNARIMPNLHCMAFTFNGFGYMLDYSYVRPYSWTNPNFCSDTGPVRGGERLFTEDEVKLIKLWRDRDGWGGLTLEEFLGGLSE